LVRLFSSIAGACHCLVRVAAAELRGAMWMLKASSICGIVIGTFWVRRGTMGSQFPAGSAVSRSETIELSLRATAREK
jgi:hypothetical protein